MRLFQEDMEHVMTHTEGLWEELRNQRLFITGGTGFFGCWLLESFIWANEKLKLNATVTVLTRNPKAFGKKAPHLASHPAIRLQAGDVRSFDFAPGGFSHVIHAVTEADRQIKATNPLEVFNLNVEGTRHVLDLAHRSGTVKFLFTSSGSVYGRQPPELPRMPETFLGGPDPTDTMSPHGVDSEAKRTSEMLCALYARQFGLETKIARCFTFVGPYLPLDGNFAIGNFIRDALHGGPIKVNGDGTPHRSYLYAADLVIWLWTILFRGVSCRPYNVGSEDGRSIAAVAESVAKIAGNCRVEIAQCPGHQLSARYVPSTERAGAELGLQTRVDLENAVSRTLHFHRSRR